MSGRLYGEAYLMATLALIAGLYWPWAEVNNFALHNFTEGIAVWLVFGWAPVAVIEWSTGLVGWLRPRLKALAYASFSTYP